MSLTTNSGFKPNIRIQIQRYYNTEKDSTYLVATSPEDCKGLVTDGKTEEELIKNIVECVELFKQEGVLTEPEYNILLQYNQGVKNDDDE